jgi:phosphatidylserine/phosphatidylglycerophosphate/cardiolipin synthase-like enzyme/regulation of enolase protein 1 (concanavalin A-like superfamily)
MEKNRTQPTRFTAISLAIAITVLFAGRTQAAESLCDPSFQDCRTPLIALIRGESVGIDVAFWFMEDHRYVPEIINKWKAGIPVRLIIDPRANASYPLNADMLAEFQQAGIPMIKKTGGGIMHWKTMIFAGQNIVEFGSANYSPNAFVPDVPYTNYVSETIFFSDDPAVVHSFKDKYDDLWADETNYSEYDNVSSRGRVYPTYDATDMTADLNFPPGQSYASRLIAREKAETQQIDVHMYRVTQQSHSQALIDAKNRGVPIRYIGETREYHDTDPNHDRSRTVWVSWNMDRMFGAGIPMRVRNQAGEYHEKLVLMHNQGMTVFGSSNWTSASDNSQQEHNYFTTKSSIFQWFEDQFNRMWNNTAPGGVIETVPFNPLPPDTPSNRSPANGAASVPTTGQTLVWYGGAWAHFYDVYFGTSSAANTLLWSSPDPNKPDPSLTTSDTQGLALPELLPGTTYYWKIVSRTAAGKTKTGPVWSFTTAGSGGGGGGGGGGGPLPSQWTTNQDVGSVGLAGSAQYDSSNGVYTVNASGADVWGSADAFHYVAQQLTGDGSIVAHVSSVTNTNAWTKAGVMFRDSLAANSAHGFMLVSAGNGSSFQRRKTTGGTSVSTSDATAAPPRWVRLVRSGNILTGFQSSNGTTWTQVGTDTISLSSTVYVGLAVTSHNNSALATAAFDSVTVESGGGGGGSPPPLPPDYQQADIGAVGIAGTAQYDSGTATYTVKASGADIWNTADAFHYVYRQWTGDGSIVARVQGLTNTNAWAKAGVMFRETLNANSVHAFALVSAGSGSSFIRRTSTGGTSVSTTVSTATPPRWVKLVRAGNTLTAYQSSDGSSWAPIGSAAVTMGSSIWVGIAVTSHNNTALTTATIENVTVQ